MPMATVSRHTVQPVRMFIPFSQPSPVPYTWNMLALQSGLTESQVRCAMEIFRELGLLEYTAQPLAYRLLPSGKVLLENSRLRTQLISMRG